MATNSCPSCPHKGDIDLSNAAWDAVTGESPSRYDGSWEFIPCPDSYLSGNTKLFIKGGSTQWWFAIQPVNFRHKIENIQIKHAVIISPSRLKINFVLYLEQRKCLDRYEVWRH